MWLSEQILLQAVRALYRTEIAHSSEMKTALQDLDSEDTYRASEINRVLEATARYGIQIPGKTVLDFGCNDGAMSAGYLRQGATRVVGVDIDEGALARANELHRDPRLTFVAGTVGKVPLRDCDVDVVVSCDVFEHVSDPVTILKELFRVMRPGGKLLIGTWSWWHPFAPHLWSTMPVPWAHMLFSEKTVLRVCRRVYHSPWYVPNRHDFGEDGRRLADKYTHESISTDYLNKFLIRDFERAFVAAGFDFQTHPVPYGSRYARWTRAFARMPLLREFLSGYVWFVLTRPHGVTGSPS
jgi:SAM-dependent methyltransferase